MHSVYTLLNIAGSFSVFLCTILIFLKTSSKNKGFSYSLLANGVVFLFYSTRHVYDYFDIPSYILSPASTAFLSIMRALTLNLILFFLVRTRSVLLLNSVFVFPLAGYLYGVDLWDFHTLFTADLVVIASWVLLAIYFKDPLKLTAFMGFLSGLTHAYVAYTWSGGLMMSEVSWFIPNVFTLAAFLNFSYQVSFDHKGILLSTRHTLFLLNIKATPESRKEKTDSASKYEIKPGFMYLVKEEKPEKSFELFTDALKSAGLHGLCITRKHPDQVKRDHHLESTPIIWLTEKPHIDYTIPPKPEQIYAFIEGFTEQNRNAIILLDGIEYLISHNNFNRILHFTQKLRDKISTGDSRIIISISPRTLEKIELKLLEREAQVIIE